VNEPTLSVDEIKNITRYQHAAKQRVELHRQGFARARMGRDGSVILERPHFVAVCAGQVSEPARPKPRMLMNKRSPA
jgi:hypothetical protein